MAQKYQSHGQEPEWNVRKLITLMNQFLKFDVQGSWQRGKRFHCEADLPYLWLPVQLCASLGAWDKSSPFSEAWLPLLWKGDEILSDRYIVVIWAGAFPGPACKRLCILFGGCVIFHQVGPRGFASSVDYCCVCWQVAADHLAPGPAERCTFMSLFNPCNSGSCYLLSCYTG